MTTGPGWPAQDPQHPQQYPPHLQPPPGQYSPPGQYVPPGQQAPQGHYPPPGQYPPMGQYPPGTPQFSGQYVPPPPPERPWYKKKRWVLPLGFVALSIIVSPFTGSSDDTSSENVGEVAPLADVEEKGAVEADTKPVAQPKASPKKLTQEETFISIVQKARDESSDGDNAFQKRLPLTNRNKAICKLLKSKRVKNWTGEVTSLDTNGDGYGVLEVQIADDIKVATWNNALSDIRDNTLIKPGSAVFNRMGELSEGDQVTFTGTFARDAESCIGEQSLTDNGSTNTPQFTMKFASLR